MQKSAFLRVFAARKGVYKVFEMIGGKLIILKVIVAVGIVVIHFFCLALATIHGNQLLKKRQCLKIVLFFKILYGCIELGIVIGAFQNLLVLAARGN